MTLYKTAVKGVVWSTVSTIIRSIVQLLQVAVLTRFLEKSDFGIVAICSLFIGFTQIFLDLGISVGIIHKSNITQAQYSSLFWLNIFCGLSLSFILILLSPFIAYLYNEPQLSVILSILSITVFLSSLGGQHRTVQQKKMRFLPISIIEITASFITLVVAVLTALNNFGIYSLVCSTLCNVFVSNVLYLMIGILRDKNISLHFEVKDTIPFLRIGIFSIGSQIVEYFSRELDVIIIGATLGKESLGMYSLCKKLVLAIYGTITPVLQKVLTPLLATIQCEKNKLEKIYLETVECISIISSVVYCLMAIFSNCIINTLYGPGYLAASITFSIMCLYYAYLLPQSATGSLNTATGQTNKGFQWSCIRVLLNSSAVYIGSFVGITGIVSALLIITIFASPIFWKIVIRSTLPISFSHSFMNIFSPYCIAVILALPVYMIFKNNTNILICCFLAIGYLIIYSITIFILLPNAYIVQIISKFIHENK